LTTNIPKSTAQGTLSLYLPRRAPARCSTCTEDKHNPHKLAQALTLTRRGSACWGGSERASRRGLMSRPCSATPIIFRVVAKVPPTQRKMDAGKSAAKLRAAPRTLAHFCEECTLEEHRLAPSLASLLRKSTTCGKGGAPEFSRLKGKDSSCPDLSNCRRAARRAGKKKCRPFPLTAAAARAGQGQRRGGLTVRGGRSSEIVQMRYTLFHVFKAVPLFFGAERCTCHHDHVLRPPAGRLGD